MSLAERHPGLGSSSASGEPRKRSSRASAGHDVTEFLCRWHGGDDAALDGLVSLVYSELRRMAGRYLNHERPDQTLQTHDLIHEAFLRLIGQRHVDWRNRAHFFGITSRMMRRILTDHARRRLACKNGGGARPVTLGEIADLDALRETDVLAVDEALEELKKIDEQLADIVTMRFFGGLEQEEIAAVLGVSVPTVGRRFRIAKAWLYRHLGGRDAQHGH